MTTNIKQVTSNGKALFDYVIEQKLSRNDAHTAKLLGLSTPFISNMRNNKLQVGASTILAFHESFDMPISTIRAIANVPRKEK